jgi:uncharacterized protein (TIGR02145 family)
MTDKILVVCAFAALTVIYLGCKKETRASCSDGIKNGTETDIDCGGSCSPCTADTPKVTDMDGNVYHAITIGTQVWMMENLRVTRYQNGDIIGTTTPAIKDISAESAPKYQWAYKETTSQDSIKTHGRLYTWYAATDSRIICPLGWHVPSDAEWATLTSYLGGDSVAGAKMKEAGTSHWNSPNKGADNSSGFTGLPSGMRHSNGSFDYMGLYAYWWSSTPNNASTAWMRPLSYTSIDAGRSSFFNKRDGFCVRCIQNQ